MTSYVKDIVCLIDGILPSLETSVLLTMSSFAERWQILMFAVPVALAIVGLVVSFILDLDTRTCVFGSLCIACAGIAGLVSLFFWPFFWKPVLVAIFCGCLAYWVLGKPLLGMRHNQSERV